MFNYANNILVDPTADSENEDKIETGGKIVEEENSLHPPPPKKKKKNKKQKKKHANWG